MRERLEPNGPTKLLIFIRSFIKLHGVSDRPSIDVVPSLAAHRPSLGRPVAPVWRAVAARVALAGGGGGARRVLRLLLRLLVRVLLLLRLLLLRGGGLELPCTLR
eukprot:Selendium_serpulae@DN5759_c0_g1_i2.p3